MKWKGKKRDSRIKEVTDAGAGQHTMRKLRLKDIPRKIRNVVPIRLCQERLLKGWLNLGSGKAER